MMGFGGFGGYAFPTRRAFGDPQSGQVLSNEEFTNAWGDKVKSTPRFLTGSRQAELIAGNPGYDAAAAAQFLEPIRQQQKSQWDQSASAAGWDQAARETNWLSALNMGYIPTIGADGAINLSADAYTNNMQSLGRSALDNLGYAGSHVVNQEYEYKNPEYDQVYKDWAEAERQRAENTTRQQQAYDTYLMGNNQIGGVMGSQYRNPAFGQVSGQKQGDVLTGMPGIGTGFGGITGVDDTSQTGAYTGGAGKYNPNPFAPGAFRNANPWA